eukprot:TRINITY_DN3409_c3_g1_i1.p2 TRINITY_DN3409_c3_g1~~TRINITY_DN3409_c3_g1_i1.p2  ORF type:complete len:271 (-),score=88.28 TRINITY_DN3409_c3_g1_i1:189-887(-)
MGVKPWTSSSVIKKKYLRLAKRWHPDVNKDDPEAGDKYMNLRTAYDVLKDAEKRDFYNAMVLVSFGTLEYEDAKSTYDQIIKEVLQGLNSEGVKEYWQMVPKMPKIVKQNKMMLSLVTGLIYGVVAFYLMSTGSIFGRIFSFLWTLVKWFFKFILFGIATGAVETMLGEGPEENADPNTPHETSFKVIGITIVLFWIVNSYVWPAVFGKKEEGGQPKITNSDGNKKGRKGRK